jgi:hypothetical protein
VNYVVLNECEVFKLFWLVNYIIYIMFKMAKMNKIGGWQNITSADHMHPATGALL